MSETTEARLFRAQCERQEVAGQTLPGPCAEVREAMAAMTYDDRPILADTEAVAALRDVISTFYALPYANPVPKKLVQAINRAEDFLQRFDPCPF